jgi:hypothetical protein
MGITINTMCMQRLSRTLYKKMVFNRYITIKRFVG